MADSTDSALETEARTAIARARDAAPRVGAMPLSQRLDALAAVQRYVLDHREEILDAVVAETGKCRTDALIAEILGVADYLQWLCRNGARLLRDERVPTPITLLGKRSRLLHEPLGTVLVIAPWNYPVHTAVTTIAASFAAGNATVYKPSEVTPLRGLIERIMAAAEPTAAATHVVYGDGALGAALVDQRPDKIFFTGSTDTGRRIAGRAAEQLIPVDLELGGKDAMIVFDDAPLDRCVAAALWGAFTHCGQSCSAVERLYVQAALHDRLVAGLRDATERLTHGPGQPDTDLGRMTARFQVEKVRAHVDDALAKGATAVTGGAADPHDPLRWPPTILTEVDDTMLVMREETFGPVLPVARFDTEADAVAMANDSAYGLCGSVFTADAERGLRVARALRVGGVSINNVNMSEGNPGLPFGGVGHSGDGRIRGRDGLLAFTRSKSVLIDRSRDAIEANWYPYTAEKYRRFDRFIDALYGGGPLRLAKVALRGLRLESWSQRPR